MNNDFLVEKIVNYAKDNPVIWRALHVKKTHTRIWEAKNLDKNSPFQVIKLYQTTKGNNSITLCSFISNDGDINIISNRELQTPKLLGDLCKIAQDSTNLNRELESLNGINNLDDVFKEELFVYYYLQKEQEKRQTYKRNLLMTLLGMLVFSSYLVVSLIFFLDDASPKANIKTISLAITFMSLSLVITLQFLILKRIKNSLLTFPVSNAYQAKQPESLALTQRKWHQYSGKSENIEKTAGYRKSGEIYHTVDAGEEYFLLLTSKRVFNMEGEEYFDLYAPILYCLLTRGASEDEPYRIHHISDDQDEEQQLLKKIYESAAKTKFAHDA